MKRMLSMIAMTAGMAAGVPAGAADILFYARNNCRGPVAFRYPANETAADNCKSNGKRCSGHNDEARSLFLPNGGAPWRLAIYDSPDAGRDDDYAEIKAPATADRRGGVCIATFEPASASPLARLVTYHRKNGLDGKVSYIAVNSVVLR